MPLRRLVVLAALAGASVAFLGELLRPRPRPAPASPAPGAASVDLRDAVPPSSTARVEPSASEPAA